LLLLEVLEIQPSGSSVEAGSTDGSTGFLTSLVSLNFSRSVGGFDELKGFDEF
jgi:hypothetical protein